MSEPEKSVDLSAAWSEYGVKVKIPIPAPRSTKNTQRKKRKEKEGSNTSARRGKETVEVEDDTQGGPKKACVAPPVVSALGSGPGKSSIVSIPFPAAHTPSSGKEVQADTLDPDDELHKQKEKPKEKMRKKGVIPSIADLEACQ